MIRWYTASFNFNDDTINIKFTSPHGENIMYNLYLEIQDYIFWNFIFINLNNDLKPINGVTIDVNYKTMSYSSYEEMKKDVVPLSDVAKLNIMNISEIIPCDGCVNESGKLRHHMRFYGCASR
jgi:hypothetical protein